MEHGQAPSNQPVKKSESFPNLPPPEAINCGEIPIMI